MILSRIILIILCIVTAALYVRVLLPPEQGQLDTAEQPQEQTLATETALQPLPADQMQLVLDALAPETEATSK